MSSKRTDVDMSVGLCLGGGGGLGFLHLGLFQAMEELGIRPGLIAGTSAGAAFGALYAAGKTIPEMKSIMKGFKWNKIVAPAIPHRGFLSTYRMEAFFKKNIGDCDISDLPIRLKIAAVDVHSGELMAFDKGPLWKCLAASCAIPGFFQPVIINKQAYYDASGMYNLPIELMHGENLKTIIAGNTISRDSLMKKLKTPQDVYYQAYLIRSVTLTKWRTRDEGWPGRKDEKIVMIDYRSMGTSLLSLEECMGYIDDTRSESIKALSKVFGPKAEN
jgi:NTE family protein